MHTVLLCVVTAAIGGVGWRNLPEGGMEYIIQLDPQYLDSLRDGATIQSDIPANVGDIRSYRIVVGTKQLPRETPLKAAKPDLPEQPPPQLSLPTLAAPPNAPSAPRALALSSGSLSKPLPVRRAVCVDSESEASTASATPTTAPAGPPETPAKPWLPLTLTLMGLFASIGANLFLGWMAWDARQHWRLAQKEKLDLCKFEKQVPSPKGEEFPPCVGVKDAR